MFNYKLLQIKWVIFISFRKIYELNTFTFRLSKIGLYITSIKELDKSMMTNQNGGSDSYKSQNLLNS